MGLAPVNSPQSQHENQHKKIELTVGKLKFFILIIFNYLFNLIIGDNFGCHFLCTLCCGFFVCYVFQFKLLLHFVTDTQDVICTHMCTAIHIHTNIHIQIWHTNIHIQDYIIFMLIAVLFSTPFCFVLFTYMFVWFFLSLFLNYSRYF